MTLPSLNGAAAVPHLGVIRAEGDDAAKFLHSQLTQDFALLDPGQARLAAFCNAKGRMLASFIGFRRAPTEYLLVTHADLLQATLRRLSMFVLRAKVRLSDESGAFTLLGLVGPTALAGLGPHASTPWVHQAHAGADWVSLYPADGVPRALWLAPAGTAIPEAPVLDEKTWRWLEVRSAVTTLSASVAEAFVPQMLNYESVGGVNFKKGCYPGQEVVARSQFRGTLKRRAWPAHAAVPLQVGDAVFHESDPEQPCGLVAQAAASPHSGWDAIVSVQVAAAQAGRLAIRAPDGPELTLGALPYPLLADV